MRGPALRSICHAAKTASFEDEDQPALTSTGCAGERVEGSYISILVGGERLAQPLLLLH
jgi:hypothetical protein